MKIPIVLIGGGGHCLSCIDVIRAENKYEIAGILDSPDKVGSIISGVKITGTDDDIPEMVKKYGNFLITVGQIKSPSSRIRLFENVEKLGGNFPVVTSPLSYISPSAVIGSGTVIMHRSIVNANAFIGKCCIINSGALIEHESRVGDFSHISTQAVVNGQVTIGMRSFVGSNAVISNNLSLPEDIVIAAGACVFKSPGTSGTYIGNPARKINDQ
jgi:sugar O-acyltransferase (sialic acid O-acetyltransferase NeuD family)